MLPLISTLNLKKRMKICEERVQNNLNYFISLPKILHDYTYCIIMKKIFFMLALLLGTVATQAQSTVEGTKFLDNWSITLKGGAVMPYQHYAFWPHARGIFGLEVRKDLTTALGVGLEGELTINTSSWEHFPASFGPKSPNVIDHQLVGAFMAINLTNAFNHFKGERRFLEVEAVMGGGWFHAYHRNESSIGDYNSWYTKAGVNFNWNLGKAKAWTVSLKPSVMWDMNGDVSRMYANQYTNVDDLPVVNYGAWPGKDNGVKSRFNANHAWVELEMGLTYHFGNSNGTHYFTLCPKRYTQADINAANAQVNELRGQLNGVQGDLDAARARTAQLQRDLNDCNAQKNTVKTVVRNTEANVYEVNVFYTVGSSVISNDQMPNVERVASYLKSHKDATVVVRGYASPEGSKSINERLATNRANSVRDALVKKYGIKANRINAAGQGVGNMFEEPTWNRVSVCTIDTGTK